MFKRTIVLIPVFWGLAIRVVVAQDEGGIAGGGSPSPVRAPRADDRTFVIEPNIPCTFRDDGPLQIEIPVTRYAGETDGAGHLVHADFLRANGMLSEYAVLHILTWDVDYAAGERDTVYFNGHAVNEHYSNNACLTGRNEAWVISRFQIPIEWVRFPAAPGSAGTAPTPAVNAITIHIDTATPPPYQQWCVGVNWMSLSFEITSPLVLVHGITATGAYFDAAGFTGALGDSSTQMWIPYDNTTIDLTENQPDTILANAEKLKDALPDIATSFGVDSLNIVAHSKGGLDVRDYLATYYGAAPFKVISLTTLSTPHNGSVLADIFTHAHTAMTRRLRLTYWNFPSYTGMVVANLLSGFTDGNVDLQTTRAARFNGFNIPKLPKDTRYHAVAADADVDGSGTINFHSEIVEAVNMSPALLALESWKRIMVMNVPYQNIRNNASAMATVFEDPEWGPSLVLSATPNAAPAPNDIAVSISSGLGSGGYIARLHHMLILTGSSGRNHTSVVDRQVANAVLPWIVEAERANGDLSPR